VSCATYFVLLERQLFQTFFYPRGLPRTEHISCCCYVLTGYKGFILTSEYVTENTFCLVGQELSNWICHYFTQRNVNTIVNKRVVKLPRFKYIVQFPGEQC
jgi:hypothetical protein